MESSHISISNGVLQLSGVLWDHIEESEIPDGSSELNSWFRICMNLDKIYVNGQTRVEVLWRTLIGNQTNELKEPSTSLGLGFREFVLMKSLETVLMAIEMDPDVLDVIRICPVYPGYEEFVKEDSTKSLPTIKEITAFLQRSLSIIYKEGGKIESIYPNEHVFRASLSVVHGPRMLFRTAKSLLGLGPKSAEKGDAIWFFSSSDVPFILRHVVDDRYELIGEAYIHSYMHKEWKEKNLKFHRISIQ